MIPDVSSGENMVRRLSRCLPSSSVSPSRSFLSPTTTAATPRSCAARTFVAKSQPPRSTRAMTYGSLGIEGRTGGHARGTQARSGGSFHDSRLEKSGFGTCPPTAESAPMAANLVEFGGGRDAKVTRVPDTGKSESGGRKAGKAAGRWGSETLAWPPVA